LHLAAAQGHAEVVRALNAGADPEIRDTKHAADALGWAEFFKKSHIVQLLRDTGRRRLIRAGTERIWSSAGFGPLHGSQLPQPSGDPVPTGAGLVHQPPLA
jgi:hypothetical protein